MFRYFDIHTHHRTSDSDSIVVINSRLLRDPTPPPGTLFSIGIHPYDIANANEAAFVMLENIASQPNCVAIGECGIDKRLADIELQSAIFKRHVEIAQKVGKPLIIHCVRAENEILTAIKSLTTPAIFHSYAKYGSQIANRENTMFSQSNKTLTHPDISKIPISKILFETDDDNISIKTIYQNYCATQNLELEAVAMQIELNFSKIFNIL